jgi:hypothetical protein
VERFKNALDGEAMEDEVIHHTGHCFDYIRQSIMCAGDTTLEGLTEAGPGWGSKHECADYDALLEWANDHTVLVWRANMPEEATL